jgi:hypothetical protein
MADTEFNPRNPAVAHCIDAYNRALEAERACGSTDTRCVDRAKAAFCAALPHLEDRRSIRNYIACVAWGQVNGIIWHNHAPKWLYSAQVALQALPPEPYPAPGRPKRSAKAPAQASAGAAAGASEPTPAVSPFVTPETP